MTSPASMPLPLGLPLPYRAALAAALVVSACATPLQRLVRDSSATDILSAYARAAADAGLSIPFPVRTCEEHRALWTAFDPVRICVDTFTFDESPAEQRQQLLAISADEADASALGTAVFGRILPVAVLSAAVVNRRLPDAPRATKEAWARALTRAYLLRDGQAFRSEALRADLQTRVARGTQPGALHDALNAAVNALGEANGDDVGTLVTPIPPDFAAWALALQRQSEAQHKQPARKTMKPSEKRVSFAADAGTGDPASAAVYDAVTADAGTADAGAADPPDAAAVKPADARAAITLQLIGVWAANTAEANIEYVLCTEGNALIRSPDWPRVFKQRWEIKTADPLVLSLTTVDVDKTATVEVTHLDAVAMTWSVDGETVEFVRKSARASCD